MNSFTLPLLSRDYPFLWSIKSGAVRSETLNLHIELDSQNTMNRTRTPATAPAGEFSLARHIIRVAKGDRSIVAIPFFVHRSCPCRQFYVKADSPIRSLTALEDHVIATPTWTTTGDIWRRLTLRDAGSEPEKLRWLTCESSPALADWAKAKGQAGWNLSVSDKPALDCVLSGEAEILSATGDHSALIQAGEIRHLLPDMHRPDHEWLNRKGYIPANHLYAVPASTVDARPDILKDLCTLLEAAQNFHSRDGETDHHNTVADHPYNQSIAENSWLVSDIARELMAEGFIDRPVSADELFAEFISAE